MHRIQPNPAERAKAEIPPLELAVPVATTTDPVAVTVEGKDAIVGEGTVPSVPLMAFALAERLAKPTAAGS